MMQSWLYINFTVNSHLAQWQQLVSGLSRNQHGAFLEEYAEPFGPEAMDRVERLLDVWEIERGEVDTRQSTYQDNRIQLVVGGYRVVEQSKPLLIDFLMCCGAQQIEIVEAYDTNGS